MEKTVTLQLCVYFHEHGDSLQLGPKVIGH